MEAEKLFQWTANLVLTETGESLNQNQERIFYKALEGKTYQQIADSLTNEGHSLSEDHAKRLGSAMWKLIKQATGLKKVDKNNFRVVIQALMAKGSSPSQKQSTQRVASDLVSQISPNLDFPLPLTEEKKNTSLSKLNVPPAENLRGRSRPQILGQLFLGPVEIGSQLYINRQPVEEDCYQEIEKPGALVRIKAPKEMGKTSLIERIIQHCRKQEYRVVSLSFEDIDKGLMSDLDPFLKWICFHITRKLNLPNRIADYWDEEFSGSKMNCSYYLKDYILSEVEPALLLVLDDVDRIFEQNEIVDDFFGLLRSWHENANKGQNRGIWKKLRLVISYSTEAYLIKAINQSPFNVGLGVLLPEFNPDQVQELATKYGLNWCYEEIEKLMAVVGGHPHLVQIALNWAANKIMPLDELIQIAPSEKGPYINHLRRHLQNLTQQPELLQIFRELLEANAPISLKPTEKFKLLSTGLIKLENFDLAVIRCQLYRLYFQQNLT